MPRQEVGMFIGRKRELAQLGGLVKRGSRSGDRRFTPVALTDSGRDTVDLINRDNNGFFRDVFCRIEPDDHENLLCCFSELVRAMGAENSKCTEGKTCCSYEADRGES